MDNGIIKEIKKYILKGLESKIEQILKDKSKNMFLTKRDLLLLSRYMKRREILSYNLIRYIFKRSIYSHSYDPQDEIIILFKQIIIIACEKGDLKVVRLLLSDGVVQKYNSFYISILLNRGFSKACIEGNLDMIKFLLEFSREQEISLSQIDPCESFNRPLLHACQFGHIEIVKYLLEEAGELYPKMREVHIISEAVYNACALNQIEILKFLLSREIKELYPKTDPCRYDNVIMRSACGAGRFEIVKLLLSDEVLTLYPNINPCVMSNYPIILASQYSHHNIVKFLLSDEIMIKFPKIEPSEEENLVLRNACNYGQLDIVKYLLSNEMLDKFPLADVNSRVKGKEYFLDTAKQNGHTDIVKFLLELPDEIKERNPILVGTN